MIIIATGDWHLTTATPKRRKDDYWEAQWKKIKFIFDYAKTAGASCILQPGDFTDSHKANDFLKQTMINWANKRKRYAGWTPIYCVYGQHDMRYHSNDLKNTPLRVLEAAKVVNLLGIVGEEFQGPKDNVVIFGAGWNQEIPIPGKECDSYFKILVTHRMVYQEKLWEKQEEGERAYGLMLRTKFDVIVSGDNHRGFIANKGPKYLINCGSLMRMKSDQLDHKPFIVIIDTHLRRFNKVEIPIQPSDEVFDIEKVKREKARDEKIDAFVTKLKESDKPLDLDFAEALRKRLPELDDATRAMLEEIME